MENTQELIVDFKNGDVILFVGAGISMNSGLPGWGELFRPLSESVDYLPVGANLTTEYLLTVAQYYENKNGRHALVRYLMESLDTTAKFPSEIHSIVSELPVKTIFTTNYDDLLEKTYREKGQKTILIVENFEFAFSSEKSIKIVKLCGDINRPNSLVVTKRDFNVFPVSHSNVLEKLRNLLETKTVLFLGYSLKDPFVNQIWDVINFDFGKYQRFGYCVLFDADPLEVDDLKRRNLHVINLSDKNKSKAELLSGWLKNIIKELSA